MELVFDSWQGQVGLVRGGICSAAVVLRTQDANNSSGLSRAMLMLFAYAFTVHKSQGLTMLMVYLAFSRVLGFGQLYTALPRCPHVWATFLVGVPPKDVLDALLRKNQNGHTLIEAKRLEVMDLLEDEERFSEHVQSRIVSGEFDLDKIAADCARSHANTEFSLGVSLDTFKQEAMESVIAVSYTHLPLPTKA